MKIHYTMKLLLTGKPRSGKTTLLNKIIQDHNPKKGFVTEEIREDGERTGFKIVTNEGKESILASKDYKTEHKVSKYYVEIKNLDELIPGLQNIRKDDLLYIDEIGEMELFSEDFKKLVLQYLEAPNDFIGTITIVYEDEFTRTIRNNKDVKILEVTPENRDYKITEVKDLMKR